MISLASRNKIYICVYSDCIREGNGNPLQYSCLENPVDGGARWATVKRVAKSQMQLSTQHKGINILRKKKFGWTICLSCQVTESTAWDKSFD